MTYALSTVTDGTGVTPLPIGQAECPKYVKNGSPPPAKPASDWSTDTLKADCAGRFTLCYEVKAGNVDAPSPTDCTLAKVCVSADYLKANEEQAFPPLGPWVSDNTTCVAQFTTTGGYGEMTVIGESVLCDKVDDGAGRAIVFNRVKYCSPSCSGASKAPECTNCGQGAGGTF